MSIVSNIHKRRLLRKGLGKANRKRYHLPKQYYHDLKNFAGTAEFASLVIEHGNVTKAILSSDWYAEVSCHPNFNFSRQCEIWMRRMEKVWKKQQAKRARLERVAAKVRMPFQKKPVPEKMVRRPKDKSNLLQALARNEEVYVVCTSSLSPAIAHQKLLMRYDAASGSEREDLARQVQANKNLVRAKVFVGKIKNSQFAECAGRFSWQTGFEGALFEVQFESEGFKSAWKARLISTGNCNTVKGWRKHYIHRRTRMPVRFSNLVFTRLKEGGKSHLIRDLGLARLAA